MKRVKVFIDMDYREISLWGKFIFTIIKPAGYTLVNSYDYGELGRRGFYSLTIGDRDWLGGDAEADYYSVWNGNCFVHTEVAIQTQSRRSL